MPIKGLSDIRRIPRDSKIKIGEKRKNANGKEYPVALDYFKFDESIQPKIEEIYGCKPKEIDVMIPCEDLDVAFPQYRKCYGKTGLKCKGDGEKAIVMVKGEYVHKICNPDSEECEKSGCKPIATLNVLLPKIPGARVYPINTSSWNSIVNLNSCIEQIKAMTGGRISFINLKLKLEPHIGQVYNPVSDMHFQKQVYVMSLSIEQTIEEFCKKYYVSSDFPELTNANAANAKIAALLENKKNKTLHITPNEDSEFVENTTDEDSICCEDCDNNIVPTEKMNINQIIDYGIENHGRKLCVECLTKLSNKYYCVQCNTEVSKKVNDYSNKTYNTTLCRDCQKSATKLGQASQ